MADANVQRAPTRVPAFISLPGPIVRRLLQAGMPIGPNVVLTIRGRNSGQPRPQPLALIESETQRFVIGTFGDVNWCRNLRANPNAELSCGRSIEAVRARELDAAEATIFFRDSLPAIGKQMPLISRLLVRVFVRLVAPDIDSDPASAALHRPMFELLPVT